MATTVTEPPFEDRRVTERRRYPAQAFASAWAGNAFRVSWGGIWAGVFAALGAMMLLASLGIAVGITAVDLETADPGAVGTGAAIWGGLSLLVALFFGGMLSTRLSMITNRSTSVYEGGLVWVLSVILIMYLAGSGVGMLAGGALNLVTGVGHTMVGVSGAAGIDLSRDTVDQIVARLEDPATARQVATATGVPEDEVRARLQDTAQAVERVRNDPAQVAAEVRRGLSDLLSRGEATERIERAGRMSAWVTFFSMLLSLGAAVWGAAIGRRRAAHHRAHAAPYPT